MYLFKIQEANRTELLSLRLDEEFLQLMEECGERRILSVSELLIKSSIYLVCPHQFSYDFSFDTNRVFNFFTQSACLIPSYFFIYPCP